MQILLERLELLGSENIIIATSHEETDDVIAAYCNKHNINVFRGSLNDVAGRFLAAACHFKLDYAVRINGDNLFADAHLIKDVTHIAMANQYDFVSNVPGRTFPTGMSIEVIKTSFYNEAYSLFKEEKYLEHVTLYFYEHPDVCKNCHFIQNEQLAVAIGNKMAIDTKEDIDIANKIIEQLGNRYAIADWKEIVQLKLKIA